MQQPAPTETEIAQHAQKIRGALEQGALTCDLTRYMLDLIYAGHTDLAWQFFDVAWPPDIAGKTKFLAEFISELAASQYWLELRDMNNFDFIGYMQDQN
jgi:hypothetical protein